MKIVFGKDAVELLKKGFALEGRNVQYDKHLYTAYKKGYISLGHLKRVSSVELDTENLKAFDELIYNARCAGKVLNFIYCFSKRDRNENILEKSPYNTQFAGSH